MKPEEIELWLKTLPKEMAKHSKPSEETLKLFSSMQKQVDYLVKTFDKFIIDNKEEHKEIICHQKETNGNVKKNTEARLRNENLIERMDGALKFIDGLRANISLLKWMLGFVGFGNLIIIAHFLAGLF